MNGKQMREASIVELRHVIQDQLRPERLRITRGFDGSIDLRVLSSSFEHVDAPLDLLKEKLRGAGVQLPERTLTMLKAPSELEDGEMDVLFGRTLRGTPVWGDALLLEPSSPLPPDDRNFGQKVVAFWGLKGGVGRSTALAHVATLLGRRQKVLAVDLDLDSPGLVATLAEEVAGESFPRFEELVREAAARLADQEFQEKVFRALRRANDSHPRVQVLGPAAADADFVKSLVGPLAPAALYRSGLSAVRRLLRTAILASEASIVLVDARSGYCDESAMTVLDLADEVVMFVSPAPSTYVSLAPAIEAFERNRQAIGRPRLIHVVAGMMPAGLDARRRILEELVAVMQEARNKVAHELGTPPEQLPPDITGTSVVTVEYSARIVENEGRILPSASDGYRELADRLSFDAQAIMPRQLDAGWVSQVLREAKVPVAQAEDEEDPARLADLFTSTRDLEEFVRQDVCLVLGAKGTGKSYLRRVCLEDPAILAQRSRTRAIENVLFVDGYSQVRHGVSAQPPITSDLLRKLDADLPTSWRDSWSALALGRTLVRLKQAGHSVDLLLGGQVGKAAQLTKHLDKLGEARTPAQVLAAVKHLVREPLALDEVWDRVDAHCGREGKTVTLLFDDLDIALGETPQDIRRRGALIQALIERTNNSWIRRRHLASKVFLRQDIFRALELEEEAKYAGRKIELRWAPEEIWRLVIRAMAVASPHFEKLLDEMGIQRAQLEECAEDKREAALALIWGERLGEGEGQTRSTVWAWGRLHDGANRMFPRAALWLLRFALEERQNRGVGDQPPVLDPRSLRAAMPRVAAERLTELKRECTQRERKRLMLLKGFLAYQDEKNFLAKLKGAGEESPGEALKNFKSLGIVESGSRRDGTPTVRIVDLYAFAPDLEIERVGRR